MILVADFDASLWTDAPGASPERLVEATRSVGADRLVLPIQVTADPWAVVHPEERVARTDGGGIALQSLDLGELRRTTVLPCLHTLEEVLLAIHKARLGAVLRLFDTPPIERVGAALGVTGGEGRTALLPRFLVTAPDRRVGRRLRADAPDAPSAYELRRGEQGWRRRLAARVPNLARANADADDLIVPWDHSDGDALAALSRKLAKRGARLFLGDVPPDRVDALRELPVAGLIVRHPPTG